MKCGHIPIVSHYLKTYPPGDSESVYSLTDSSSLLGLALDSREPELIYLILHNKLASSKDINEAWTWVTSNEGSSAFKKSSGAKDAELYDDVLKLLTQYGNFTPPPTPEAEHGTRPNLNNQSGKIGKSKINVKYRKPLEQAPSQAQANGVSQDRATQMNYRGRGRGRGRGEGRGRGRGRGQA